MADLLTKHLKTKSESHSSLQLLFSQWDFDRQLIPKALQTIGNLFPHYSRHDESHSKQILVNIERLLGSNLELLTATDTWLLLEAAYWHDIGMVVPHCDLEEAMSDPDFDDFLNVFTMQPFHELYAIALSMKNHRDSFHIFSEGSPLDAVTRLRELMAEWFRRKHSSRAEYIVSAPQKSVGINSPRTELIPARLFNVLGKICKMHGSSFQELMGAEGLSFREAGMGNDDCHPRFVACLLRLGDLLDLDDNRFCPVMQGIAGKDRPTLSKAHEDKHAAIRHLRIDQERISIEAECKTVDGYLESVRWFSWLKEEIQLQMSQWRDIVPHRELGLLPTLGPVSVQLSGNLRIISTGERPAFSLDTNKAIELLQGKNLYENEFACIRELLQNAVDATLLKIWMTSKDEIKSDDWSSPDNPSVKNRLAEEKIHVSLTESESEDSNKSDKSYWTLTISDNGTGISLDELQYMLRIGGSNLNTTRRQIIDSMPEWMKPSGAFGIGFQSIFMLCDHVSLNTKSLHTNEILELTMYSPIGPHEGLVVIKQLEHNVSLPIGTTIKACFTTERFAKTWSVPFSDDGTIAYQFVNSLDPVLDDHFPYIAASLADKICEFGKHSPISIKGELKTQSSSHSLSSNRDSHPAKKINPPWRFIKTQHAEVKIRYLPQYEYRYSGSLRTLYRGQEFEAKNIFIPNVCIEIDLLSGPASSWLNFSRDKISAAGREKLRTTIIESLDAAIRQDIQSSKDNSPPWAFQPERIPYTSLFLKIMAINYEGPWVEHAKYLGDAWLDIECTTDGKNIRNFFTQDEWTLGLYNPNDKYTQECDVLIPESSHYMLEITISEWLALGNRYLQAQGNPQVYDPSLIKKITKSSSELANTIRIEDEILRLKYQFTKTRKEHYDNAALASKLIRLSNQPLGNKRFIMHIDSKFSKLTLNQNTKLSAHNVFSLLAPSNTYVLLPFLFRDKNKENDASIEATPEQLKRLYKWVQPQLRHHIEIDEIQQLYEQLISWIDNEVMANTYFHDRWLQARGLS